MMFSLRGSARGKANGAVDGESSVSVTRVPSSRKRLGTRATRKLLDRLTAQQASLVRAVSLGDERYLNHSYYIDPRTGKRIAHELEAEELSRFTTSWGLAPIECIRAMNGAVRRISEPARQQRYVKAAVELEILMDVETWTSHPQEVYSGIPPYLMSGYTDMGTLASPTERNGREKIKVGKSEMEDRLMQCKWEGLQAEEPGLDLLGRLYERVRRDIQFNEKGVEKLSKRFGNESIVLAEYLDKGMGVCRHLSIFYQLYLQEVGIDSRVVKGNLRFYIFSGRHAWNLVRLKEQVVLVDVTHPNVSRPFIVAGGRETEVYHRAKQFDRTYVPTPDEQNYYKIGS